MAVILAVATAVVAGAAGWFLGSRSGLDRAGRWMAELDAELRRGAVRAPGPEDVPAVAEVRRTILASWVPRVGADDAGSPADLFRRITGYLDRSVASPLADGIESGGEVLAARAREALDALDDLAFHAQERPVSDRALDNLTRVVQEVIREYASEFGNPVRLRAPDAPVRAALDAEAFKDALYMVLVNAGRFGGREAVQVVLDPEGREIRLLVQDRGPGFSPEALERALEPFYSTDPGSLGLGLTHVRQVVMAHGGDLRLRNRPEGGGEVEIVLPRG